MGDEYGRRIKKHGWNRRNHFIRRKTGQEMFYFESIFNPLLPVATIWLLIDAGFLSVAMGSAQLFMIPFMLFHMMPVWIYLAGVIFSFKKYKNTYLNT